MKVVSIFELKNRKTREKLDNIINMMRELNEDYRKVMETPIKPKLELVNVQIHKN